MSEFNRQQKTLQSELESWKGEEQEAQEKISDDAKDLEKISTKISTLQKKVRPTPQIIVFVFRSVLHHVVC